MFMQGIVVSESESQTRAGFTDSFAPNIEALFYKCKQEFDEREIKKVMESRAPI